ncbi:S-layer homology domain-containing protein [Cohnella terricola]|nr:S-layer homology domain-containing protein [Cohnella terricola]
MTRKLASLSMALLLCLPWMLPQTTRAAAPSYALIASDKADLGSEIQISVKGTNLSDVYAYEFNLEFDASRLKFKEANGAPQGFTVPPIVKGNRLTFAHTKVGEKPGDNGNLKFFTLTFKTIGGGNAAIEIKDVSLVNSKLEKTTQNAGVRISVAIGKALLKDMAGHWAEAAIQRAVKLGIVTGYSDGTFRPQAQITRTEFVAILARAKQLTLEETPELSFADASQIPAWARSSVSAAVKAQFISGYEDNTFRGNQPISRAEMVTIFARAFGLATDAAAKPAFADADQIPVYAQRYVTAAAEAGLISGKANNLFASNDKATRAEAVVTILRLIKS